MEGTHWGVEARCTIKYSAMHRTALPITKYYLAQNVFSAQVERACLGMPSEKRDIWPHVVTSYFIPGTGSPVPEATERTQVSYSAVFVINADIMHGSPRTQKPELL